MAETMSTIDVFRDATITRADVEPDQRVRLLNAGLELVYVMQTGPYGAQIVTKTYGVIDPSNPVVGAITAIGAAEFEGQVQPGSRALALDSIRRGEDFPLLSSLLSGQPS